MIGPRGENGKKKRRIDVEGCPKHAKNVLVLGLVRNARARVTSSPLTYALMWHKRMPCSSTANTCRVASIVEVVRKASVEVFKKAWGSALSAADTGRSGRLLTTRSKLQKEQM